MPSPPSNECRPRCPPVTTKMRFFVAVRVRFCFNGLVASYLVLSPSPKLSLKIVGAYTVPDWSSVGRSPIRADLT